MTDSALFVPPTVSEPAIWRRSGLLIGLVALVMTAILGWMVWDRISLLRYGREIVLPVVPVDPRSLFRGDYVILSYAVSLAPEISGGTPRSRPGAPVYVTLQQAPDGAWKAVAAQLSHPGKVADDSVVLRGRDERSAWMRPAAGLTRVRYGIESYFVPEGTGRALEQLVRDKKISARIAVDSKGRAAIKGLLADGRPIHEESLL